MSVRTDVAAATVPDWYLLGIDVTPAGGNTCSLKYGGYMRSWCTECTLNAETTTTYKVTFKTQDVAGADFDGAVTLQLSGWNGSTEDIKLDTSSAQDSSEAAGVSKEAAAEAAAAAQGTKAGAAAAAMAVKVSAQPATAAKKAVAAFPRGSSRTFTIKGADVGNFSGFKLDLKSAAAVADGVVAPWQLERIEVVNEGTGLMAVVQKDCLNSVAGNDSSWFYPKNFYKTKVGCRGSVAGDSGCRVEDQGGLPGLLRLGLEARVKGAWGNPRSKRKALVCPLWGGHDEDERVEEGEGIVMGHSWHV